MKNRRYVKRFIIKKLKKGLKSINYLEIDDEMLLEINKFLNDIIMLSLDTLKVNLIDDKIAVNATYNRYTKKLDVNLNFLDELLKL
jgi:hypothetical protein